MYSKQSPICGAGGRGTAACAACAASSTAPATADSTPRLQGKDCSSREDRNVFQGLQLN
jgi:hypothetical protein